MKRLTLPHLAILSVTFLLVACETEPPQVQRRRPGGMSGQSQRRVVVEDGDLERDRERSRDRERDRERDAEARTAPSDGASAEPRQDARPTDESTAGAGGTAGAAPKSGGTDYGKAVPGKPGFVTSPYAPYQGYVDVRGFPPGTEVKDPYTGKVFLVP